jgi:5'-nucleotidase
MQDPNSNRLVIGVSAHALFDLEDDAEVARTRSPEEYRRHLLQRDADVLEPGRGFQLVQALQRIGERSTRRFEIVVLSRSGADASPRLFTSMHEHAVHAARAAFTGGEPFGPYLKAFHVDVLLSEDEAEVHAAVLAGTPAAVVTARPEDAKQPVEQIRIAFDGDAAVLARASSGDDDADEIRPAGADKPLARLMKVVAELQAGDPDKSPVRTALVTRRASPGQETALKAMREWNVRLDQAFFVGDLPRDEVLEACRAHLFFDDGGSHFRIPEEIVKADLRATEAEATASSNSPFARLRLRSSD